MKAEIKKELDILVNAICNNMKVNEIYLFGSYAYGKPKKDSDFDIYVVIPDNSVRPLIAMQQLGLAISSYQKRPVDLLVSNSSSFNKRDLITANHLVKTLYPVPLEIVCYHCQQSSEKFLKGYIADQNKAIQTTHDLKLLVNECMQIKKEFKTIEQECARLTPYGVQSRYPFAMEIEEEDMKKALNDADKIKAFVNNIYKSDENNQISEENIS